MKIMVFDVPAEKGGALSILKDFYNEIKDHNDKSIKWIFVLSMPQLKEEKNIKILRFPWVKKSWYHRLFFDYFIAPKLVKKYGVDKIISFQNTVIPNTNVVQTLYVHQPLPFVEHKFKINENFKFWIYQNIIGRIIKRSIRKADKVVVQTKWMKRACTQYSKVNLNKIYIIPPKININKENSNFFMLNDESTKTFFFPAGASIYKNHKVIVESCMLLKKQGIVDFSVVFTLKGNENRYVANLYDVVKENKLPIKFVGNLDRSEVFNLYTKSVLVFPSYIETFGLPLLEARLHQSMILASDCVFSQELLEGYNNCWFFDPFNSEELASLMKSVINNELKYSDSNDYIVENKSLIKEVLL